MQLFSRETSPGKRYWYGEFKTPTGSSKPRVQQSTHIRDDGTPQSRRAAEVAGWQIQARILAGGPDSSRAQKTLIEGLRALTAAQEVAEVSEHAHAKTRNSGVHLCTFFQPDRPLSTLTTEDLVKFAAESRKDRLPISIRVDFGVLGQACRAVGMEPPKYPKLGSLKAKPQQVLEIGTIKQLLLAARGRHRIVLLLYLQLNLRLSEIRKIESIDMGTRYANIAGTKTLGSVRSIPIPDDLYEALLADPGALDYARKLSKNGLAVTIRRLGRRIGIEKLSANDLRGTYATHMARAGVDRALLAKFMGNSEKMLSEVYAQIDLPGDHHREAVERGVPKLLPSTTGQRKEPKVKQ